MEQLAFLCPTLVPLQHPLLTLSSGGAGGPTLPGMEGALGAHVLNARWGQHTELTQPLCLTRRLETRWSSESNIDLDM